jgi:DNA-binding transcriptional regulator PaaX
MLSQFTKQSTVTAHLSTARYKVRTVLNGSRLEAWDMAKQMEAYLRFIASASEICELNGILSVI